jgi:hypothetical protein
LGLSGDWPLVAAIFLEGGDHGERCVEKTIHVTIGLALEGAHEIAEDESKIKKKHNKKDHAEQDDMIVA